MKSFALYLIRHHWEFALCEFVNQSGNQKGSQMRYLLSRNGWYFYDRRVPKCFAEIDQRTRVRLSLHTQCQRTAMKHMVAVNDNVEQYWMGLVDQGQTHTSKAFDKIVQTAKRIGFAYLPTSQCGSLPIIDLIERVLTLKPQTQDDIQVKALLGTEEEIAELKLSQALKNYWNYSKPVLMNKNKDQQRKWKNSKIKAVRNFIKAVGDKDVNSLKNQDMVTFREWWLEQVEKKGIKINTVNKDFGHLKSVIDSVVTHEELELNVEAIFKKIYIKETDKGQRASFENDFIRDKILNPTMLEQLDNETRCLLHLCAQTGARPIELVNLAPEDIKLDHDVPHIHIRPRKGYSLKTKESERKIPIIGGGLMAMHDFTNGFDRYRGNSDALSIKVNKFLGKNGLRITQKHSLYSFRHSFQDRLNALEIPDRIQCQLMGHKFHRPKYGKGASLEHLKEVMERVDIL